MRFDPSGVNYHIENCQYIIDVLNIIAKKYFGLFSEPHRGSTLLPKNKKHNPTPAGLHSGDEHRRLFPCVCLTPLGSQLKMHFVSNKV